MISGEILSPVCMISRSMSRSIIIRSMMSSKVSCLETSLFTRYKVNYDNYQTHLPLRCTSARYQSLLYTDAYTSPLHIGEISVSLIYGRTYLAVAHRRDISLSYIQTHLARRCTSARYQSCLYTDAPSSPLCIGEISVFLICRRT